MKADSNRMESTKSDNVGKPNSELKNVSNLESGFFFVLSNTNDSCQLHAHHFVKLSQGVTYMQLMDIAINIHKVTNTETFQCTYKASYVFLWG